MMTESIILLDPKIIKENILAKNVELIVFKKIASTNDYLKTITHDKQIKICLAEQQTQGKGSHGKNWYSPFAENIYCSLVYPFQKNIHELSGLSLAVSLVIVKTLAIYDLPHAMQVKWPNDVMYDDKKLAGNLIEMQTKSPGIAHAIIGIGLNINMMKDEHNVITQAWTSLCNITETYHDRNQLCISLINNLILYLEKFEATGLSEFMYEWSNVDYLHHKMIAVKCNNEKIVGKVLGIDHRGFLKILLENNTIKIVSSGNITISSY